MHQYYHPSLEEAIDRKSKLEEITSHMSVNYEGTKKTVSYDNLDLSFLDKIEPDTFVKLYDELYNTLIDVEINMIISYDFSGANNTPLSAA